MAFRSDYSPEFRADAVALVLDSTPQRTIADVAFELGVSQGALRYWVSRVQPKNTPESTDRRSSPGAALNAVNTPARALADGADLREGDTVTKRGPLIVVLDPTDEVSVTRRVLAAHAPQRGAIVVHPTPGRSPAALAHDFLAALGKNPALLAGLGNATGHAGNSARAKGAALAWLTDYQVRQIAVLRAHLFSSKQWSLLLEVHRRVAAAVIVIYHAPQIVGTAAAVLERVDHVVVSNLDNAADELTNFLNYAPARRPWPPTPALPFPEAPHSQIEHFRADAARAVDYRALGRVEFAYRTGLVAACGWIATRDELHTPLIESGKPRRVEFDSALALFLAELVADCTGGSESISLLRGAQAAFLLHGLYLRLPVTPGPRSGPGFTDLVFDEACAHRLRSALVHPVHAAALAAALTTGLDPAWLRRTRITDLAPDAAFLAIRRPGKRTEHYGIAPAARSLLRAARTFLITNRAEPHQYFLSMGIGQNAQVLHASAQQCGLAFRQTPRAADTAWHHAAECWQVAEPIHGPGGVEPNDRIAGLYMRTLTRASGSRPGRSPAPERPDAPLEVSEAAQLMTMVRRALFSFEPARPAAHVSPDARELARRGAIVLRLQPPENDPQHVVAVPHDDLLLALDLNVRGDVDGSEFAALRKELGFACRRDASHSWYGAEPRRARTQEARELASRPMFEPKA